MYENESTAYRHLQQLSRRWAGIVSCTFIVSFCLVNITWDSIQISKVLSHIPNAPYMINGDTMNVLKIASKFPDNVSLYCYAALSELFRYSLFAHICMEALSYYMFNNIGFHNIFSFSSPKGHMDLTHEKETEPCD